MCVWVCMCACSFRVTRWGIYFFSPRHLGGGYPLCVRFATVPNARWRWRRRRTRASGCILLMMWELLTAGTRGGEPRKVACGSSQGGRLLLTSGGRDVCAMPVFVRRTAGQYNTIQYRAQKKWLSKGVVTTCAAGTLVPSGTNKHGFVVGPEAAFGGCLHACVERSFHSVSP